jgi:hypothetical protein
MSFDLQRFDRPSRASTVGAVVAAMVFVLTLLASIDATTTHSAGAEWVIDLISDLRRG